MTGHGGARKGAGRKPKQTEQSEGKLAMFISKEETLNNLQLRVQRAKQRLVAEAMTRLDCGADQLKNIMDLGMMPPAFTEALQSAERTEVLIEHARAEIANITLERFKQLELIVEKIEVAQ